MPRTGWGIYLPNDGDPRTGEALEIAGSGAYTLLHHQAGNGQALATIRAAQPEALIQVRCYCPNWYALTPARWAQDCWDVMHGGADPIVRYTRHLTWANEQNLAAESGGAIGATASRLATWSDYQVIAEWNAAWIAAYRAMPDTAADVLHYPGLAYGHGEDWGYDGAHEPMPGFPLDAHGVPVPAYELLRPGIDRCPILNHHPYVQRGAPVLDEWVGARRIEKTIALFPGKAIYAAETGQFDVTHPQAPDQIVEIGYYLQGLAPVVAWTPFILASPDPGHAMNDWSKNPAVAQAYQRTTRLPKPDSWVGWEPPKEPTVPDIALSVPTRATHAAAGNYESGPRQTTLGVVVHTTRGGASSVEKEYLSAVNWFANPDAGVSTHLIVGGGSFAEVCRSLHDDEVGYHCREANKTHLGIEIAQPRPDSPISDFQYRAAAEAVKKWAAKYGFPTVRVTSQTLRGIVGHEDTEAGKRDGKTDPGPMFDWARFMALVTGGGTVPPTPTDPTALRDKTWALADQLQKLGADWRQAGYPHHASYVENQGEAIKDTVAISKKEP